MVRDVLCGVKGFWGMFCMNGDKKWGGIRFG